MKALIDNFSLSAVVAGFIATVISYAGSLVIIFQAGLNIALPLAMLALTGQFVPNMAVLRNTGYSITEHCRRVC